MERGSRSNLSRRFLSTTIMTDRLVLVDKTLKNKIQLMIDNLKDEKGEVSGTKVELKVPFSYI